MDYAIGIMLFLIIVLYSLYRYKNRNKKVTKYTEAEFNILRARVHELSESKTQER